LFIFVIKTPFVVSPRCGGFLLFHAAKNSGVETLGEERFVVPLGDVSNEELAISNEQCLYGEGVDVGT
jgi:hypothetical protein